MNIIENIANNCNFDRENSCRLFLIGKIIEGIPQL